MISKELLEKKKHLNKILNTTKNEFELFNVLRTECERINLIEDDIILNFEQATFKISKSKKKVENIVVYDDTLKQFKEISF